MLEGLTPWGTIDADERGAAVGAHLAGLSGYLIPFAGIIVPYVILLIHRQSPVVSTIARQAILLNVGLMLAALAAGVLALFVPLQPLLILSFVAVWLATIVLPIIGAIRASRGEFFLYPVVGPMAE